MRSTAPVRYPSEEFILTARLAERTNYDLAVGSIPFLKILKNGYVLVV